MRCPFCGNDDTHVKDSRPTDDGAAIRRRRSCPTWPEVTKRPDLTHKRTNRERFGEAIQENQPVIRGRPADGVVRAVSANI